MEGAMTGNLRVYLSSTFSDLKDYRTAAVNTLERCGLVPVTFEHLGAMDEAPATASARALGQADIIVFLIANRYSYIAPNSEKSLMELEYDEAVAQKKPIIIFLISDDQPWPPDQIDFHNRHRLEAFKERLKKERAVYFFRTPDDLSALLQLATHA